MNYHAPVDRETDDIARNQLISGTVLVVALLIMNVLLLLNWLGIIQLT
jgi:hypothetical protein